MKDKINTYYTRLEIKETASCEDIKNAYRDKVLQWHPDLNNNSEKSKNEFLKIQKAYECLSDELRRKKYDELLKKYRNTLNAQPASSDYCYSSNYYTDREKEDKKAPNRRSEKIIRIDKIATGFGLTALILVVCIMFHTVNSDTKSNFNYHTSTDKLYNDSVRRVDSIAAINAAAAAYAIAVESESTNSVATTNNKSYDEYEEIKYNTGDIPYLTYFGRGKFDHNSLSELSLINYSSTDAVLLLVKISNEEVIRNVFVCNGKKFVIKYIPEGRYLVKVMYGNSWNAEKFNGDYFPKGGFMKNISFSQSKENDSFDFYFNKTNEGISYPTYSITLHKVINGNMKTENISQNDFFN